MTELGWYEDFKQGDLHCIVTQLPNQPDTLVIAKGNPSTEAKTAKVSTMNEGDRGCLSLVSSVWWQNTHFELARPFEPRYRVKAQNGSQVLLLDMAGHLIRTTKSKAIRAMPQSKKRVVNAAQTSQPFQAGFMEDQFTLAQLVAQLNKRLDEAHRAQEDLVLKIVQNPETGGPRLRIERIAIYE